jgi:hypothetical protein
MYCQGLGDCFLLSFPADKPKFHMLIDCGVILGTPDGDARMKEVVADIKAETGGVIDLLVGTHEHWDHVSGFVQAKDLFKGFKIKRTWLAWTEDPKDSLANRLRKERDEKKKKLALAMDYFRKAEGVNAIVSEQLTSVASFFGLGANAASEESLGKTGEAMKWLREQSASFLTPGKAPPRIAELPHVEFFVLGPPRDTALLHKDLPGKSAHETYELNGHLHASLAALDVPDESGAQAEQPFDDVYGMSLAAALNDPYFVQMYDNGLDDHPAKWRRIDDIGMYAATELALQLDSDTNNTSLVLAIRLADDRVLLFPGDAQVGNWESWHTVKFEGGQPTIEELLANTVVYKVGHHGSHNATLSKLGLELMTSPDLCALLPVDEDVAHNKKHWTKMPFAPLMGALKKHTSGRILRADYEKKHPATDVGSSFRPDWVPSKKRFSSEPKRSLFLEISV